MTPDTLQLYKLIILYFLKTAGQPLSNAILSDFILNSGYTDYLSIQQTLSELAEDKMITVEQTHKSSYYALAELGNDTLTYFGEQLPEDTRCQIEEYLTSNRIAIAEATSVKTDYTRLKPKEYLATCTLYERGSKSFEVALNVPTEEDAVNICRRFEEKNSQVYAALLRILTTDETT